MIWIPFTLMAAFMQSVRTAGQKQLSGATSIMAATTARYTHGLPFAWAYLGLLVWLFGAPAAWSDAGPALRFLITCLAAGVAQIAATAVLIHMFRLRNFAVATMYIKSEILLTAVIGSLFFTEQISLWGWLAMVVAFIGLIFLTAAKQGWVSPGRLLSDPSALWGLTASLLFALTSLLLRDASQQVLHDNVMLRAACVLVTMVSLQALLCLAWMGLRERPALLGLWRRPALAGFVGFTSLAGSAGWFTAMAAMNASYVKTLGQVELFFVMLISLLYFREVPKRLEWIGFAFLVLGILLLLGMR
jgi:drug/metabolite transporter (DMT)-like permease